MENIKSYYLVKKKIILNLLHNSLNSRSRTTEGIPNTATRNNFLCYYFS